MQSAVSEQAVWERLSEVIDPELGCSIVDLGLIYDVRIDGSALSVAMTFTTPGCPMHEALLEGVKTALRTVPGVETASVRVVWDPPWNPSMMKQNSVKAEF